MKGSLENKPYVNISHKEVKIFRQIAWIFLCVTLPICLYLNPFHKREGLKSLT